MHTLKKLVATLLLGLFLQQAVAATATIATASNFKTTMIELIARFEASHPHQLQQVNAASGVLYNQIIHGAPFDALLAANRRYPAELEKKGAGVTGSRFTYAEGALVLAASQRFAKLLHADNKNSFLQQLTFALESGDKIAIANPTTAPYGIAARQTLQQLGLWQNHPQQWVRGTNINQSLQYVVTGNAGLGLVALSQVKITGLRYWPIPNHYYQPIRQQAILLQFGQRNPAATAFLAFLKSAQAKTIIHRHGYNTADKE